MYLEPGTRRAAELLPKEADDDQSNGVVLSDRIPHAYKVNWGIAPDGKR
jgi:hypothetical protein